MRYTIFISGFLQRFVRPDSVGGIGLLRLANKVREEFGGPDHEVWAYEWDVDVDDIVESIFSLGLGRPDPEIVLVGYSWGGQAVVNLAESLQGLRVPVKQMILCDAVVRKKPFRFRDYIKSEEQVLTVPGNVDKLFWMNQTNKWPRGAQVVAENERTEVTHRFMENHTHFDIDESVTFELQVYDALLN